MYTQYIMHIILYQRICTYTHTGAYPEGVLRVLEHPPRL